MSENAIEEDPPREEDPFDFLAKPEKFYMTVETVGSLRPREVIIKVSLSVGQLCSRHLMFIQGLEELQTKLANLIHGLKSTSEVEMMEPNGHLPRDEPARPGGWGQSTSMTNGNTDGWKSPSASGWNV